MARRIEEGYADYAAGAAHRGVKAASRAKHAAHIKARKKAKKITDLYRRAASGRYPD